MKLGKLEAKHDDRNIKFMALLPKELPSPPSQFDVDFDRSDIWPLPMPIFGNDNWGDCVMAGRANHTLRFEKLEQGQALPISDNDVLSEYWREQGDPTGATKPDNGLYVLDSLKSWRSEGWFAAEQRYNIYAFAQIDHKNLMEVRQGIYLLGGLGTGVALPLTAKKQLEAGQIWTVEDGPDAHPYSWGGHYMMVLGYTQTGPVFLTWGQRQVATWEWWIKYVDECYGIVDDRDKFLSNSPLDIQAMDAILKEVTT